ncbi:MAG: peptidylprolyl isomerase [Saprospiraceae bacterium]|nr:peptidylprolyl isomerase [Saprospiraceae bacterium]
MLRNTLFFSIILAVCACSSECEVELIIPTSVNTEIAMQNEVQIQDYLTRSNLTAQATSSGLHYIIDDAGGTNKADLCSDVTARYTGYLTNGYVFDTSDTLFTTFTLANTILGWQEGIQFFGEEGKGTLLIPSKLAYGPNPPTSDIPENAVLVFDVEIAVIN